MAPIRYISQRNLPTTGNQLSPLHALRPEFAEYQRGHCLDAPTAIPQGASRNICTPTCPLAAPIYTYR